MYKRTCISDVKQMSVADQFQVLRCHLAMARQQTKYTRTWLKPNKYDKHSDKSRGYKMMNPA